MGSAKKHYKWDIVWINVFLIGSLHLAALFGIYFRYLAKFETILFAKTIGVLSTLGVTAGAHRLWSHNSYKASFGCQVVIAAMMTLTYQNSIFIWCRDHRLHHKFSETDADPHNAKRGFFFSHVGWLLVKKHKDVLEKGRTIDMSDLKANPIVMFQHKYYHFLVVPCAFIMPSLVPWYFWNENIGFAFLCAITTYVISVNLTWCINSLAHLYGIKPYDKNIGPTENYLMRYIGFGEGFHNYHHTFPWDYRASEYGFEGRNMTAGFIDFLALLGFVSNRKTATKDSIVKRAQRTGDGSSINNGVNHIKSIFVFIMFMILI